MKYYNPSGKDDFASIWIMPLSLIGNHTEFIMSQLNIKLKIIYDKSKPDGTPRKILNVSLANNYGWKSKISLKNGFSKVYETFLNI